jgi:predicted transcriptional regulator
MIVKFGNLVQPHHSEDPNKPEAKDKVSEMMQKLNEAGFVRQENIKEGVKDGRFYHVFDLPHQIEFGGDVKEAIEIMTPYSEYMKPLQVVG